MQWSRLRAKAREMVAEPIRKRVDFHTTSYGPEGSRGHWNSRAWITIDGREVLNLAALYSCTCPDCSIERDADSVFGQERLTSGLAEWVAGTAEQALQSDDALIQALAILDRRVGKRRLAKLQMRHAPPLSRLFFLLRCEGEEIDPPEHLAGQAETLRATLRRRDLVSKKRRGPDHVEARRREREAADNRLASTAKDNLGSLIDRLASGETARPRSASGAILAEAITGGGPDRENLLGLLRRVERRTQLLHDPRAAGAVCFLAEESDGWVRPPQDWEPPGKNATRQFASLARWLWARFDVPELFDQAWFQPDRAPRGWWRHLGAGGNLRTAAELPCPLNKRMAHHTLQAPTKLPLGAAIRWGQTRALGGDRRLADAIAASRMRREFAEDPFWLSLIRFFVRNPALDHAHVGPIVDYVWAERFEPQRHFPADGEPVEGPPRQPNLSMAGRRVAPLLREVERWHGELNRSRLQAHVSWDPSGIEPYRWEEGSGDRRAAWVLRELLSSEELFAEGRRMQHCVGSYAYLCARGELSIWSLERQADDGAIEPRLTVEVTLPKRWIAQMRGPFNRLPKEEELSVVDRWARQAGLYHFRVGP